VVYVGSFDTYVYALNASNGSVKWKQNYTTHAMDSSPVVVNGVLYFCYEDGSVWAVNASTGVPNWVFNTFGSVDTSPAVWNGEVFVNVSGGLLALRATDGSELWDVTSGTIQGTPVVAAGKVYVGEDESFFAVNASNGNSDWEFDLGSLDVFQATPAVANGRVYAPATDDHLYVLNSYQGSLEWMLSTHGALASPAIANGVTYVGGADGTVYALDASTGSVLWTASTGGAITSSPAVANGKVYVAAGDGKVYAYALPVPPPSVARPSPAQLVPDRSLRSQGSMSNR